MMNELKIRDLSGRQRVRARKERARKERQAIADFVARTGADLVDEDEFMSRIHVSNDMRRQSLINHAFANGARPWR